MIAKGTPHKNGALLARYLVTGKDRERAELWQLRGFALGGIVDAFRSVHVMAEGTRCRAPFFHVYVRNREGESLNRQQWECTADRIERVLGLNDQPRAIAFHTAEDTGRCHMHIAWSRIDQDTLTAKPLPFFKHRLKKASRELEELFDLPPVPNKRESAIHFAPTRAEEEQARRLGLDVHVTRDAIRNCFERSDGGQNFEVALSGQGLLLARGDSRDFLVVDREGGIHALGKRILGVTAAEIRHRLSDLGRDQLPSLDQARQLIAAARAVPKTTDTHPVFDRKKDTTVPTRERKTASRSEKSRAAGNEQPLRGVRTRLVIADPAVRLDHLITDTPAPPASTGSESVLIHKPGIEPSAIQGNAAKRTQPVPAASALEEQASETGSRSETAGPESAAPLPEPEIPLSAPKAPSRLRDQFRALVKQLTARDPAPRPASRKRRREEMSGGFRKAAGRLLRSVARIPPLHFLDPAWEPFTWLRLWQYNNPPTKDFHSEPCAPTFSNQSPHL